MDSPFGPVRVFPVPDALGGEGTAAFLAVVRLTNERSARLWGNSDFEQSAASQLAVMQPRMDGVRVILAPEGPEPAGACVLTLPLADNTHLAWVDVLVDPHAEGQGLGRALLAAAEAHAAEQGRTVLEGETEHRRVPGGGRVFVPATGAGEVPADRAARFTAAAGFTLEQSERISVLEMDGAQPGPVLERSLEQVQGRYELVSWSGHAPADVLEDYALLRRRMSTDVPMGNMDWEEEDWDAARVRLSEDIRAAAGYEVLCCAVRDAASGRLAGHTILEVNRGRPGAAMQDDTLVLREHRGHGLGMLLKAANLERLASRYPGVKRVYTWNAEENRHMLAINEALGFRPAGWAGQWQKRQQVR
ncbi:GNAT family N-acetyltransferase [Arthrobacter gandavensis]|uniref:GNAT family N-acetyltransferase n=1 Tax=Arthrobacter gandavensis TaxID=169960 RepID=UPI00188E42B4|nr:GNAT family N-acetyltransferase [Arthrobacter gandavensis]MBF4993917.1 GNAT family N-acetyltransferase [Arthrobacter gandavensis]